MWRGTFSPLSFILNEISKLYRNRATNLRLTKGNIRETRATWEIWGLGRGEHAMWKRKSFEKQKNHSHEKKWIYDSESGRDSLRGSLHEIKLFTSSQCCLPRFGIWGRRRMRKVLWKTVHCFWGSKGWRGMKNKA